MKQIALPLGERRKPGPFYLVEPDTRAGEWRVVDSATGEVKIDRVTKGRAWAWVRTHR